MTSIIRSCILLSQPYSPTLAVTCGLDSSLHQFTDDMWVGENLKPGYNEGRLQLILLPLALGSWASQRGHLYVALSNY